VISRVLLVDDAEANRYVHAARLRQAGFEVIEAATGGEALARLSPEVDVVVLDVNLPDMSGFEACARIKANRDTTGIPVMHVSATAVDVGSRAQGLDGGAEAYLVEPVEPAELIAVVRSLCRTRAVRRVGERLTRFVSATLPLGEADTVRDLLQAAASGAAEVLGRPAIAMGETESGLTAWSLCPGRGCPTVNHTGREQLSVRWRPEPTYLTGDRLPVGWRRLLDRTGVSANRWFVVPVFDPLGRPGKLAVALPRGRQTLVPEEENVLGQLAETVTAALTKLRAYTQEHQTALTLQRALLPDPLPLVPGLSLAARYIAGTEHVSVGGDFYDVFTLPSGKVALVIGDVQGHSLQAANVMAELRFSLRAYLFEGHCSVQALGMLNDLLQAQHPEFTATLALVVLDQRTGTAEVTNAGHLPPLVLTAGVANYIEEHGILLGAPWTEAPTTTTVPLSPGTLLVLTTDGLVERRGQDLDTCLSAMRTCLLELDGAAPGKIADQLLKRFTVRRIQDDVAVLVARRDEEQASPQGSPTPWQPPTWQRGSSYR
jgi:serine phosphatase RsbU (regulator of sigma subunit)/DNA-binding NarL/FixJ family response regulator